MAATSATSSLSDPASISANRAGQFAPWQRQLLQPPALLGTQIILVLAAAAIAVGAFFFLLLPLSAFLRDDTTGPKYNQNTFCAWEPITERVREGSRL